MVSKVAVIGLVAIIAVPILLGYGLNFQNVTETRYGPSGDGTIVTPLLMNSYGYNTVSGDPYVMNGGRHADVSPLYVTQTSNPTSGYQFQYSYGPNVKPDDLGLWAMNSCRLVLMGGVMTIFIGLSDSTTITVYDVTELYYNTDDGLTVITTGGTNTYSNAVQVTNNVPVGTNYGSYINVEFTSTTPDDAATNGIFIDYYARFRPITRAGTPYYYGFPAYADKLLLTIDLYSTSNDFSIKPIYDTFDEKTIDFVKNGQAWDIYTPRYEGGSWVGTKVATLPIYGQYDSIYQIGMTKDTFTLYYVGTWPPYFGFANVYRTYGAYDLYSVSNVESEFIRAFTYTYTGPDTLGPTMRIDDVRLLATTYYVVRDKIYDPTDIKPTNPVTKISSISQYGQSIGFGGHTYTVSEKSITLNGHKIPLEGMMFESVPDGSGGYDNRINGTTINNSANPSYITFGGAWGASIETDTLIQTTVTINKWVPGSFGWDGIDTNFKMAGLLTCLGAFIALGMYGHRSGAKVIPLMLVCGGATLVFILML